MIEPMYLLFSGEKVIYKNTFYKIILWRRTLN